MRVRLLAENYMDQEDLYQDFKEGNIEKELKYFSQEFYDLEGIEPFPIYMGKGSKEDRKKDFLEAFKIIEDKYIYLDRELLMEQRFWHSLYLTVFRDYVLDKYPEVIKSKNNFNNVVLKPFDWENYIYKSVIAVQYIYDNLMQVQRGNYYEMIVDNLDVYNYLIKYKIFRNDLFLIKILDIINKNNLSEMLKMKIKDREDLGKDERYGRRVIFEFNKAYPTVMSPMMDPEKIEKMFMNYLNMYLKE